MKCVLSIRSAFNFRRMCEQSDSELRKIVEKHSANPLVELRINDSRDERHSIDNRPEIKGTSSESDSQPIHIEPMVEIRLDATSSATFCEVAQDTELEGKRVSPEVVELPLIETEFNACQTLSTDEEAPRNEPRENDNSNDSFEQYEMWEKKQKLKRKKMTIAKIKMIKARYGQCDLNFILNWLILVLTASPMESENPNLLINTCARFAPKRSATYRPTVLSTKQNETTNVISAKKSTKRKVV